MIELRPYQIEVLEALQAGLRDNYILLLQAATGAGKTTTLTRLIRKYYYEQPARRFLILMHKQELVTQFVGSFQHHTDVPVSDIGICCASLTDDCDLSKRITIASVQSFAKKMDQFGGADLVIVDEAHRISHDEKSQYRVVLNKLREYWPEHRVIGCTATSYRLSHGEIYGTRCRPGRINFFPALTCRITYSRLLSEGHLCKLIGRVKPDSALVDDLSRIAMSNGDYAIGQLGDMMAKPVHTESAVDALEEFGEGRSKVCVFACTIAHTEALVKAFTNRGHTAVPIHSKLTPIERAANMEAWKAGSVRIGVSVNVLVEGVDIPALDCLIFCRPTLSPVIFIQATGRILRTFPGKEDALLIDLTKNTESFGTDLDNPKFTIPKGAEGEGDAPSKVCPGELSDGTFCGSNIHASLRYCPDCGFYFEPPEVIEGAIGDLKHVEFNKAEPPETYIVEEVFAESYVSKNSGKKMLRVRYGCEGYQDFFDYVCLPDEYSGYAVEKARTWWEEMSDEPFPDSVEEAVFLSESINCPTSIEVQKEGRFFKVLSRSFKVGEDMVANISDMVFCRSCNKMVLPVEAEGKGPHAGAQKCGSCGSHIKWIAKTEFSRRPQLNLDELPF